MGVIASGARRKSPIDRIMARNEGEIWQNMHIEIKQEKI